MCGGREGGRDNNVPDFPPAARFGKRSERRDESSADPAKRRRDAKIATADKPLKSPAGYHPPSNLDEFDSLLHPPTRLPKAKESVAQTR